MYPDCPCRKQIQIGSNGTLSTLARIRKVRRFLIACRMPSLVEDVSIVNRQMIQAAKTAVASGPRVDTPQQLVTLLAVVSAHCLGGCVSSASSVVPRGRRRFDAGL